MADNFSGQGSVTVQSGVAPAKYSFNGMTFLLPGNAVTITVNNIGTTGTWLPLYTGSLSSSFRGIVTATVSGSLGPVMVSRGQTSASYLCALQPSDVNVISLVDRTPLYYSASVTGSGFQYTLF